MCQARWSVTAHYDSRAVDVNDGSSRAPGANDNASGVAAMMEIARLLSSQEWNMDVIFIAFAAEEQGTHGSLNFVTERLIEQLGITAVFNNDIIGGRPGIPQSVRVFTAGPDTSPATAGGALFGFAGRFVCAGVWRCR